MHKSEKSLQIYEFCAKIDEWRIFRQIFGVYSVR
jgi:hypothetical protein